MIHLNCSICDSIFEDACTLPCGHCFCLSCIIRWLKHNPNCQICGQDATVKDIVSCYALRKAVDSLASNPAVLPEIPSEDLSFNLNDELGSGISGTVYLCEWADTSVALKLVRKADQKEARLLQEVSHMASLSHPFVLRVFGITRLPKHIGILMELGSGHLQVPTSLSPTTLAQAIEICTAVKYLHSKGIVHHDIKPQNVIIVNSQVKLADFGSSRTMYNYTSTLEVTPKYTPFEAFKKIYGPAFDVYSLGILFYEMFANRLAFEDMLVFEVVMAKQNEHILSFPEDFPKPISSLINKCLSVNPSERPSINDVLKELKEIQGTIEVFELNNSLANDLQIEKSNDELAFEGYQEAAERGDPEAMVNLGNCFLDGIGVNKNDRQAVYWFLEAISKGNSNARTRLGKTIQWCQQHAELGDELAMTAIGVCFYDGQGIEKDQSKAVYWYQKAADLGHSGAMGYLGVCYHNGQGIEKDHSKAVYWYQKAADLGHSGAMRNLGVCYDNGQGIEKDHSKAVYWYQKAADLGHSGAMYNIAVCYKNGQGIEKDQSKAVFWVEKAADLGHYGAMHALGCCYHNGQGIEEDHSKAVYWYQKAADLGHSGAMRNIAVCYKNGQGIEKDQSKAVFWVEKAADLGNSGAMCNLGDCYYDGQGIEEDHSKAVYWYQKAADLGNSGAMVCLGDCYFVGEGIEQDDSKAVYWYQKAADLGNSGAMRHLGDCYYDGQGIEEDHSKVVYWYQKAADLGNSGAMHALGDCFYDGQGIEEDHSKAVYWYQKAADLGNSGAMVCLGDCYFVGEGIEQDDSKAVYWYQKAADLGNSDAAQQLIYLYGPDSD
ncbi:hypothetical protein GEMRC1_009402 [Eukaryota sp. GEM-RC1]